MYVHTVCGASERGLTVGCVNARSVGNKACSAVPDDNRLLLNIIVSVETWHERSGSTTLQRVIPSAYQFIAAARSSFKSNQMTDL